MSLERLSTEINTDPTNKGYGNMTNEQILSALNAKNIPIYKIISSAELLAWAGGNTRLVKLENAAANHSNSGVKNVAKIAVKMIERDGTQFDFNKPDRVIMLNTLISGGVLDNSDKIALSGLGTDYISRASQLGLPSNYMIGDIAWAKTH
jgi:hypothetical protein